MMSSGAADKPLPELQQHSRGRRYSLQEYRSRIRGSKKDQLKVGSGFGGSGRPAELPTPAGADTPYAGQRH